MKKDMVIELLKKIQKSNLSIEDTKSLFNRSEKLLIEMMSSGNFTNNVEIVNHYNSDEDALKALKIYLSVKTSPVAPDRQTIAFNLLRDYSLINTGKVFQYTQYFLSIPDEVYFIHDDIMKVLLDNNLEKRGLNLIFANFIIEHGNFNNSHYLKELFIDENLLNKQNTDEILNRALVIAKAGCQEWYSFVSILRFFRKTTLDDEKIILKAASIIGNCTECGDKVCDFFLKMLPNDLEHCEYYLEAGRIMSTLKDNISFAQKVIEDVKDLEKKLLLLRILKNCKIEFVGSYANGKYNVEYGSVSFISEREYVISDIIFKIINTNYVYYYLLENSVSKDKNDDINVSDLTNKLVRIKESASKAEKKPY